jgi:hypothetical protein
VQVWTVVEGFGIGSEFRQTRCAANNFRDHEVLFRWFQVLQSVAHLLDLRCDDLILVFDHSQSSMGMFQLMHSHFIFLDSVKAILVHCAHRLLSESTRILCGLRNRPGGRQRPATFARARARSLQKTPRREITPRTEQRIYRDGIRIQSLAGFFRLPDVSYQATTHKAKKVRGTGYLLWDDDHNGSADVGSTVQYFSKNGFHHPWRSTAWEIHPVMKIEVLE